MSVPPSTLEWYSGAVFLTATRSGPPGRLRGGIPEPGSFEKDPRKDRVENAGLGVPLRIATSCLSTTVQQQQSNTYPN